MRLIFVETDSGLWQGQDPKDAIGTQAAYTYRQAVVEEVFDLCKTLFEAYEVLEEEFSEGTEEQQENGPQKADARALIERTLNPTEAK